MRKYIFPLFCLFFVSLSAEDSIAEYQQDIANLVSAYEEKDWQFVIDYGDSFIARYPNDEATKNIYYYLAMAYYSKNDYELCNDYLTQYLQSSSVPEYFDQAFEHKFLIAEQFRAGARKRIFKWQKSPGYLSALEDAITIYDEIINTLPYTDLAARSLYGRAKIYTYFHEYDPALDSYLSVIKKFPKHELAVESFVAIAQLYLEKCLHEHLDPSLLESAEINYRKFVAAFPGEPSLQQAATLLGKLKEAFADNLYQTGRFFERTYKPKAASIYYKKTIKKFPQTKAAMLAKSRLKSNA